MRRGCVAFAALIALGLAALGAAPAADGADHLRPHRPRPQTVGPRLPIAHAGRWLTDTDGRVVIVHGTNMVDKLSPFYPAAAGFGPADAAFLKSIGFNVVRVGVLWQGVEPEPGVYDQAYINEIADTVNALASQGILSVLDFHQDLINQVFGGEGFPSWAVQSGGLPNPSLGFDYAQEGDPALQHAYDAFWDNDTGPDGIGLQDDYAGAWGAVASHFTGSDSVLGYELFNEPFPGTLWESCLTTLGCPGFDRELTSFYNLVDSHIRAVDPRTLIFYEPSSLFNEGVNTTIGTIDGSNIGFAFHDYCLPLGTTGCDEENDLVFQHATARVKTTGQALLETEFGATDDTATLESDVAEADANMVPWLEWAFCACGDPTTVDSSEGIVVDPSKPLSGTNLIEPTLTALVEPYPQVISGTPDSYGYDHATHTFTFTYSTAQAGTASTSFPAGSVTQIATPAMDYPNGYRVQVSGATVTSAPNAAALTLASNAGAGKVSITVMPVS